MQFQTALHIEDVKRYLVIEKSGHVTVRVVDVKLRHRLKSRKSIPDYPSPQYQILCSRGGNA